MRNLLGVLRRSSCLFLFDLFAHPDLGWIHLGPADDLDQVGCSLGAAARPVRAESLSVWVFPVPIVGPAAFRYPFLGLLWLNAVHSHGRFRSNVALFHLPSVSRSGPTRMNP